MTVRGYCRSSQPPKGARNGRPDALGIESQRAEILSRFPDAVIYTDAAKSGRHGVARRPALRELLSDLEPGDVVAVVRLDRLARNLPLSLALETAIEHTHGCRLFSLAGEGTSLDGPPDAMAVFARRVAAAVAELQAHQAAAATAAALAVRRKAGLSTNGTAPYGFQVDEAGRVVPNADEQRVIEWVLKFTRGRLHNVTGAELAERLNEAGLTNRGGRPWNRVTAKRLAGRLAKRAKVGA